MAIAASGFRVSDVREYDPLSVEELGRHAAQRLMEYSSAELPPPEPFNGVGVYTIHYRGNFAPYAELPNDEPIYAGKAELPGKRQGRVIQANPSPVLYKRLCEHADSIRAVENLGLRDFRCWWLVLDPVWIGLTEQVLIATYRPTWNSVVDGFGNHDPGGGRRNQRRSLWDALHPGRRWAEKLRDSQLNANEIMDRVAEHRGTAKKT